MIQIVIDVSTRILANDWMTCSTMFETKYSTVSFLRGTKQKMRILFCSSYTIRLLSKICWTKYVFPLCVGPTTKSENLWRKLNSGQDLVAKDVVRAAVLGLFAGGKCSLCFTRFCPGFSTFI